MLRLDVHNNAVEKLCTHAQPQRKIWLWEIKSYRNELAGVVAQNNASLNNPITIQRSVISMLLMLKLIETICLAFSFVLDFISLRWRFSRNWFFFIFSNFVVRWGRRCEATVVIQFIIFLLYIDKCYPWDITNCACKRGHKHEITNTIYFMTKFWKN